MDIAERVADAVPEDATAGRWGRLLPQVLKVLQPLAEISLPRTASLTYEPSEPEEGDLRSDVLGLRIPTVYRADSDEAEVQEHMHDLEFYLEFYWKGYSEVSFEFAGDSDIYIVNGASSPEEAELPAEVLKRIITGELGPLYPRGSFEPSAARSAYGWSKSLVVNAGWDGFRPFFRHVTQPRLRRFYAAGARWCHVVGVHETELEVRVTDVPCAALEFQRFSDWQAMLQSRPG